MIARNLFGSSLHEHAEPAQRVRGVMRLAPDSAELAHLLAADPAPEVRAAAALHCADLAALGAALETESDPSVRAALTTTLGTLLAETQDHAGAATLLESEHCTDDIRAQVARHTTHAERRRIAIAGIRDEEPLVALALEAEHAHTRKAAAERVHSPQALRRLADAAKNKDRGVARHARQRADAIQDRASQDVEADAILAAMDALVLQPGSILTPAVELDRRWRALDLTGDTARRARWDTVNQVLRERFDREQEERRARARFERSVRELMDAIGPHTAADALPGLRAEHTALHAQAQAAGDETMLARLAQAHSRLALLEQGLAAQAGAEAQAAALVDEAEQLAAGTFIDNANLPQRWQAIDRALRTPALTRRFEAALIVIEHRRLAQVRAAQQQSQATHERMQGLLDAAEQALAAGQLHAARAAYDEALAMKSAGAPSKPTQHRLEKLEPQLVELERWESFGQRTARVQLCDRAEALATQALDPKADPSKLAADVRKLRSDWKTLDQQHAGVPRSLWLRFDGACEKAYAPAAAHFAQQAAQYKQARKQRAEFIDAAAAHAQTLLGEPRDWRAIEHWLRDTDRNWRDGQLGSVDPGAWKKLDARLKSALAPLRDALSATRGDAKAGRQQLIAEVTAVAAKATERDAPSQVKAIQARWQEQAKSKPLPHREEQALWEQFRAACDAVFSARNAERKQEDDRKHAGRRALEQICAQLEQLAQDSSQEESEVRRRLHELQQQWSQADTGSDPALRGVEARYKKAKAAVDATFSARARSREAAVWQTLAAKELLCDELDALVFSGAAAEDAAPRAQAVEQRWAALPALAAASEKQMVARRDAALRALADPAATDDHYFRIEDGVQVRRERLAELEMLLALDTPAEFQAQRLAVQVKKLRDRFKSTPASSAISAAETLLAWCAQPGVADAGDRQRCERVFQAIAKAR